MMVLMVMMVLVGMVVIALIGIIYRYFGKYLYDVWFIAIIVWLYCLSFFSE